MTRCLPLWAVLACAALGAGCVDQRYVIDSDPRGAMVFRNGVPLGPTPVDDQFVYHGNYHFTLVKDGYETLQVDQQISPPWYEYPPLDFVSEVLNPFRLHEVHQFSYQMRKVEQPNPQDVLNRGEQLRQRGQSLVGQAPTPPEPEAPPMLGAPEAPMQP